MAILVLSFATAVALADTPPAAAPSADATKTATTTTTTTTTSATTASTAPSAETIKKARQLGLIARKRKGKTMYCQDVADVGTRFATEHCYDEDNLDTITRELQAAREQMHKSSACGGAGCGTK
jgi:hypothetical protein